MNITNFRELGGYETVDGLHVKKGIFYRSSPIIFAAEKDREEFAALHMKTILDLRSPQETEKMKDEVPNGCRYIQCNAVPIENVYKGNFDMAELIQEGNLKKLECYVGEVYKKLPFKNQACQTLFDLMRKEEVPVVFHCSAGKDRTGFLAYLILKTLGVPDETIMQDYMLSNVYRKEENEKILSMIGNREGMESMLYVREEFLQSSIDAIVEKYGDFETYLEEEYHVTEEDIFRFRKQYLE